MARTVLYAISVSYGALISFVWPGVYDGAGALGVVALVCGCVACVVAVAAINTMIAMRLL